MKTVAQLHGLNLMPLPVLQSFLTLTSHRQTLGCGSGCTISEEGFFQMSAAEFKKAAQVGFDFKLIGKRGNISGVIPATAFQEVLKLQK